MTEKEIRITAFMKRKLERLRTLPENQRRAELAELRHGIGHAPGELPAIWGAFLTDLPEEFYRNDGNASPGEWAVYTALTMFALHQHVFLLQLLIRCYTGEKLMLAVIGTKSWL